MSDKEDRDNSLGVVPKKEAPVKKQKLEEKQ